MRQKRPNPAADYAKQIFDLANSLTPGSMIPINFSDESQREAFRIRFYNEKKDFAIQFGPVQADTVICKKLNDTDGRLLLLIEKVAPMSQPFIINPDGTQTPINITPFNQKPLFEKPTPPPIETTPDFGYGPETEAQRIARLLEEDASHE